MSATMTVKMTMTGSMRAARLRWALAAAMAIGAAAGVRAADEPPAAAASGAEAPADPNRAVWEAARAAARNGPQDIDLGAQAVLHLPDGETFIPQPQATKLLQAMGNPGDDPNLQGLVFPGADDHRWFMTVRFQPAGYVKDDDAKDWNADEMLKSFRDGTEEANKARAKMGTPGLEILGWAQKPTYDAALHRLVWAMSLKELGAPADSPRDVNYNTYALGRDGYYSLNLITAESELEALKPVSQAQLEALQYKDGKRYADFDAKTDHVAEYGLAALVVGVAAKKLGLIAMGGLFFAKFAKVILITLAALGGGFAKFFRRKPAPPPPAQPTAFESTQMQTQVLDTVAAPLSELPAPPPPADGSGPPPR